MKHVLTLSPDELHELTGTRIRRRQAKWLAEHGYRHEPRVDGSLSVLRAEVEGKLLSTAASPKGRTVPNLGALDKQ